MPQVSVIIPTYNRATYVTEAIDSVLAQTFTDYEIIVVDDGSTDNTCKVLKPYEDRIRYIYQDNKGVSAARNAGIMCSQGQWVAFLDSDDEWHPAKLDVQMREVNHFKDIVAHIVNAALIQKDGSQQNNMELTGFLRENDNNCVVERPLRYQVKFGLARIQCVLVKRDVLMRAGLFNEKLSMYEDQDLMCRLALEGPWGISTAELVSIYRRHEGIQNLSVQRFREAARCYEGLAHAYRKLKESPKLLPEEGAILDQAVASYTAAAGMEFLKSGHKAKARYVLKHAIIEYPTSTAFLRYLLSLMPCQASISILRLWHKVMSMKIWSIRNNIFLF